MIGIERIRQILPHRYPILLVDRVDEVVPGERLVARKAVTAAESAYAAPSAPAAYPLSLLLESWAQTAVLLACWDTPNPDVVTGKVELATGIRGVRIGAPVVPGDVLVHEARIVRALDDAMILSGTTTVDGELALGVDQFSVALRELVTLTGGRL
jgi:3-hydroxyacyl-[acyl-carrier-protein] dehydratase